MTLAHVILSSALCRPFTGDVEAIDIDAANIRQMIRRLNARFPGFGDFIDQRMAIAIDGTIYQNAWGQTLAEDSEVYLIPRIAGGSA